MGGSARLHCHLGATLSWWGWEWGAVQAYGDALKVDPNLGEAHFQLGEALGRCGQWLEASRAFREAARLHPASREVHGNLVLALGRAGLWEQVVVALQRLIRLRPLEAELHILLGVVLNRLGRRHEAIRTFRWAVRLNPSPDWTRCYLGEALLGPRGWESALRAYRGALVLSPHDPEPEGLIGRWQSRLNSHPGRPLDPCGRPGPGGRSQRLSLLPVFLGRLGSLSRGFHRLARALGNALHLGARETVVVAGFLVSAGRKRPHWAIRSYRQALQLRAEGHEGRSLRPIGPTLAGGRRSSALGTPAISRRFAS